ncbi:tetratricopeptide repeat protein [Luteibaculum oceani]|uniref:DUF2892 domain-containing protein n=1 Tax=Luteibaculum oceani TaxID=1294296 RepID=A0A5C6VC46_9FLAO|nr:DUF2892 domain-containing protein [Luteibaculum oceani]TXC82156.1 DUF2892 domain-containing protein [Luteibaculum oceani]
MGKFNKEIKLVISIALTVWAVAQFAEGNIGYGILLVLAAAIVILLIFRNERILMAFYHLRKNDMDKAAQSIEKIKHPEKLVKSQEAYYYFLQGLLHSQSKGIGKAEKYFVKALNTGLRMKHDQAMAKLNLAGIYAAKRRKREALNYLNQAKKLDEKKLLSDQIKMLQSQMGRI